jgi:hypothetical protein
MSAASDDLDVLPFFYLFYIEYSRETLSRMERHLYTVVELWEYISSVIVVNINVTIVFPDSGIVTYGFVLKYTS